MYRLNEAILLCTININPWLQKDFHVYKFLHEFQKSTETNVKLISLKRKKKSVYTGPLKKLFHYAIFQKFFHIFVIHLFSMFYNTHY